MKPIQEYLQSFSDTLTWRCGRLVGKWPAPRSSKSPAWVRVVMTQATEAFVEPLDRSSLRVLEVGGRNWQSKGFGAYQSVDYPEYDVCEAPLEPDAFDLIFLEQVLEHVLWPYRATRNIYQMLKPGGIAVVTTPFLVKIHAYPIDCSRWTELGLKHLLAEGGFELADIETGAWGNRLAVKAGFKHVARWCPWWHSLQNEPNFPVMVWAFARKPVVGERK